MKVKEGDGGIELTGVDIAYGLWNGSSFKSKNVTTNLGLINFNQGDSNPILDPFVEETISKEEGLITTQ